MTLLQAIEDLKAIVELAEENDDLSSLAERFEFAKANMSQCVERRIWVLKNTKALIASHKEVIETLQKKIDTLQRAHDWIQNDTMQQMLANPDLDFTCSIGTFKIQKNGGKQPIEFNELTKPTEVRRVVTKGVYPDEWVQEHTICTLKPDFEDAVRSGYKMEGVKLLDRGVHLRVR